MDERMARILRIQVPIWLVTPLVALALVAGFGGGYLSALQLTTPCPLDKQSCATFANFWRAWDIAADNYVDPEAIDPAKMTDGAIAGMLDSLGDHGHTRYLSAEDAQFERESLSGRFEGIGAYIDVRDDQPVIVQPIEGSPAERAGLRPDDKILKVNGEDVRGVTVEELRSKVRGPKGTAVTLTILHEGEAVPVDITVVRDEIQLRSVSWRMLPEQVALVQVNRFAERTTAEFRQALDELEAQGARAIVLDLRNNPGGLVHELVGVAGELLPADSTVLLEKGRTGEPRPYKTGRESTPTSLPLVVLVNENSASAAEILAGAIKDHGRGRVIGVPTYGTATVLRPFDLPGGAQVRIGTSEWLTPKGTEVRGRGIEPDELISLPVGADPLTPREAAALSAQALRDSEDTQLARALQVVDELGGVSGEGQALP
ncbi:MAG TPA: S41 family peptidase [Roseiflexaceae bacterium]|nr:S41 family peptidase [Roseiflexaceae bacterium]